jgi:hypothetical protein
MRSPTLEQNSVKTLSPYFVRFTSLILAVLPCFDRVIFDGDLPTSNRPAVKAFIGQVLKIRRTELTGFAQKQCEILVDHPK